MAVHEDGPIASGTGVCVCVMLFLPSPAPYHGYCIQECEIHLGLSSSILEHDNALQGL